MELIYENSFVEDSEIKKFSKKVQEAHNMLVNKTGEGSDYLGWLNLEYDKDEMERIKNNGVPNKNANREIPKTIFLFSRQTIGIIVSFGF